MSRVGWIITGAVVLLLGALFTYNNDSEPSQAANAAVDEIWYEEMTKGDKDAPNKFVYYTDIACPFCAKYHKASSPETDFDEDYIESGKVHMEIRVTDLLSSNNENSTRAGESAYCAADQDKFFDYYDAIVDKFDTDYFSKNIGTSPAGPKVPKLEDSYYIEAAEDSKLDVDAFTECLDSGSKVTEVRAATNKTIPALPYGRGVPYFEVNDYKTSGFAGDYDTVKQLMMAGQVK